MIKLYTFEEWQKQTLESSEMVKCPACDGDAWIVETLLSSQGNYHDIEEDCERCEGESEIPSTEVKDGEVVVAWREYFNYQTELVRKYCSWRGIPFFDGMCQAKQLFK